MDFLLLLLLRYRRMAGNAQAAAKEVEKQLSNAFGSALGGRKR